jgi:hypothetical protein
MISNEKDLEISRLQDEIDKNSREIHRLQYLTITQIKQLRIMQAERDEQSGLRIKLINLEWQSQASYQGGRF